MNLRKLGLYSTSLFCFCLLVIAVPNLVSAEVERFQPRMTIGDGKNGNAFATWSQPVRDLPIESITAVVRKIRGGTTTLNLRIQDRQTFEGKRVSVADGPAQTVSWNGGGQRAAGAPLKLQAYGGEVSVESVEIRYADTQASAGIGSINTPSNNLGQRDDSMANERCRQVRTRAPRIEVGRVRADGGIFSGKYKIQGSIYGQCIQEAGYFESGRLKDRISFPLDDSFQRQDFEVKARSGERGEIRVFTTDGREDSIDVEDEIARLAR